MDIDYRLCTRIIKLCLDKHGQEAIKGYVSSIHPELGKYHSSKREINNHIQWLESKNLVRQVNTNLASAGTSRLIISLTEYGHQQIIKYGILSVLGFRGLK